MADSNVTSAASVGLAAHGADPGVPPVKPLVSVISPVYNEEAVVAEFVRRIAAAVGSLSDRYDFEIVLVNDGSRDRSLEVMKQCLQSEPRLRVVELARNYGQTAALQAGLDAAHGEILVTLDSDLQHFPEEIPRFLDKLEEGFDMVCGWRHHRAEGMARRWPSRAANLLIRWISGLALHDFGTTFRVVRFETIRDLRLLGEFHRFIPVLAAVAGGRVTEIPIENVERPAGRGNYGLGRTHRVFLDLIVLLFLSRYLDRPMRAFGALGLLAFGLGGTILAVLLGYSWVYDVATVRAHSGWFMVSVMLLLASVQITMTGILAEIMVRIHYGGDRRVYRVRHTWPSVAAPAALAPRA
jgi:glycosyltransferase involved in cell wall biosynthesis